MKIDRAAVPTAAPLSPALHAVIADMLHNYNGRAMEHNRALHNPGYRRQCHAPTELPKCSPVLEAEFCRFLEQGDVANRPTSDAWRSAASILQQASGPPHPLLTHPDCQLIHVLRFLVLIGLIRGEWEHHDVLAPLASRHISVYRQSHPAGVSLRDLAGTLGALGIPEAALRRQDLATPDASLECEPDSIWPYYAGYLHELQAILGSSLTTRSRNCLAPRLNTAEHEAALRILSSCPQIPADLQDVVWQLAISADPRSPRGIAQAVAARLPDLPERLAAAVCSQDPETRRIAAEWMGRLGDRRAVQPLDAAARRERHAVTCEAMLAALERLGQPVDQYQDRDRLLRAARRGLQWGLPDELAWFPWIELPRVSWRDTGETVPKAVIHWLLVQSYLANSPRARPQLRRYCALMNPEERMQLGNFVLQVWVRQDLRHPYSSNAARRLAQQNVRAHFRQGERHVKQLLERERAIPPFSQADVVRLEDLRFRQLMKRGSVIEDKGLLAVCSACCGPAMIGPIEWYLRGAHTDRAAQCRALIAMLAAIDSPAVRRFLLANVARFSKTAVGPQFQTQIKRIADRESWTPEEWCDRTLPTLGLGRDGTLTLRSETARLVLKVNARLKPVLLDQFGQPAAANTRVHPTLQRRLVRLTTKLRKFAQQQALRLYEAMCSQREWKLTHWQTDLLAHPLMRQLCARLIWSYRWRGELKQTFRLRADGTLIDSSGLAVSLSKPGTIRIAHQSEVLPADAVAWKECPDRLRSPLFAQFGRGVWCPPAERRGDTSLRDFQGYLVTAHQLRRGAEWLGYTQGPVEPNGWFFDYWKTLPGLDLQVRLGFSGQRTAERRRVVALLQTDFHRLSRAGDGGRKSEKFLPLEAIPAILLSECYQDLRQLAASGSGYERHWAKQVSKSAVR